MTDCDLRRELRGTLPVAIESLHIFTPPRAFGCCPREHEWSSFLTLLDSVLGLCDATPGLLATLEDRTALSGEIAAYLVELDAVKRLRDYATIVGSIGDRLKWSGRQIQQVLFKVNVDEAKAHMLVGRYPGEVYVHRATLEREIERRPGCEIVLVKGASVSFLLHRFPYYWRDMKRLTEALEELAPCHTAGPFRELAPRAAAGPFRELA